MPGHARCGPVAAGSYSAPCSHHSGLCYKGAGKCGRIKEEAGRRTIEQQSAVALALLNRPSPRHLLQNKGGRKLPLRLLITADLCGCEPGFACLVVLEANLNHSDADYQQRADQPHDQNARNCARKEIRTPSSCQHEAAQPLRTRRRGNASLAQSKRELSAGVARSKSEGWRWVGDAALTIGKCHHTHRRPVLAGRSAARAAATL